MHVSLLFTAYASSYTHMHIHVITYIALIIWIKLKLKMPNFLTYISSRSQHKLVTGRRQHMVVPAVLFWLHIRTTKWALASFLFLTAVEVKSTPAFTRLWRLYVARCRRGDWHLGTPKLHWPTAGSVRVPRAICRPIYIRLGPIQRSSARAR
jgi:hypothetical protein